MNNSQFLKVASFFLTEVRTYIFDVCRVCQNNVTQIGMIFGIIFSLFLWLWMAMKLHIQKEIQLISIPPMVFEKCPVKNWLWTYFRHTYMLWY
jgi:hypothetical protein